MWYDATDDHKISQNRRLVEQLALISIYVVDSFNDVDFEKDENYLYNSENPATNRRHTAMATIL